MEIPASSPLKIGLIQHICLSRAPAEKGGGLLYRCKADEAGLSAIRGDAEEKVVYKIIEEAGNKGTWIRDIRVKSNLAQAQLTKGTIHIRRTQNFRTFFTCGKVA